MKSIIFLCHDRGEDVYPRLRDVNDERQVGMNCHSEEERSNEAISIRIP